MENKRTLKENWITRHQNFVFPLLAFAIPLIVRTLPEVIMGKFAIGFDPMGYYIPFLMQMKSGVNPWVFLGSPPFFYFLLSGLVNLGAPIVFSLKFLAVTIFSFLGICIYYYAKTSLFWSNKKSLLVALIATLYFVALRTSFDLLRTELALVFLFLAMIFLKTPINYKNGLILSLAMVLVVLSDQYIAVIMLVIILVTSVYTSIKGKKSSVTKLLLFSLPAALLFCFTLYGGLVSSQISPSITSIGSEIGGSMSPAATFGFASYPSLITGTFGFLAFCYLPLLPLLLLGFGRFKGNLALKTWMWWIIIAVVSALIPVIFFNALAFRWTLLLIYPLAFYVVEAIDRIRLDTRKIILAIAVGLVLATLSLGFIVAPNSSPFPYYKYYPQYFPTSMLQNTLPLQDCQDTVNSLQWIKSNMPANADLLVHAAFYGWALLYLNRSQLIPYGYGNPQTTASNLIGNGSTSQLYLIWWVNGSGWYGQPNVSSSFNEIYQSGRIAVYIYNQTVT